MAIGINDDLTELLARCEPFVPSGVPCPESLAWAQECHARGLTVRQMAEAMATDPERQTWAAWCRLELAPWLSHAAKVAFSDAATAGNPRLAAHMDIHVATSKTEGDMLAARWSVDELPNIARQLEEGVVERVRG